MSKPVAALLVALAVLGAAGVVLLVFGPDMSRYRVPSETMVPTVEVGDVVMLNRDADPVIGDVVIHHPPISAELGTDCGGGTPRRGQMCARPDPERAEVKFIKRIVAGPGERIAMNEGRLVRDGEPETASYVNTEHCGNATGCHFPRPITVPEGHYFLLGDNRGASDDSRFWGPVPDEWILGRVDDCAFLRFSCSPLR